MWLTRLSIQRPVFVIVLMTVFIILGFRSRGMLQVEERPRVDIPYVTVTTVYPGTGPAEMESLITKPIEDAVSGVNGIRNINSSSQYGISFVQLEFFIGTDSKFAAQEVRQKVDSVGRVLPEDIDPPVVDRYDINSQPILYVGLTGDRTVKQLRFLADTVIKYRLAQAPGVGNVEVNGGDVREIRVSIDKHRLQAYGLSINDVVGAIYRSNSNVPSGHITEGVRDYDARVIGEFQNVDEIKTVKLPMPMGGSKMALYLRDVATVEDTVAERALTARVWMREKGGQLKGSDAVGLTVTKLSDANTIETVDNVRKAFKQMEADLPGNVRFQEIVDASRMVRFQLEDINLALIIGALLAVMVVFLFLHNLRGTIICAIAIPTSLVATFIPMYFFGQSLNSMTMLGLSLVVGILVDDSIVVLENIFRHLHHGETPTEAALNGRGEIGQAAIIITLVDVVVFLPMVWMGGIIGMFFRAFGITVAVAALFSLLVSFTVTPWLASRWFRLGEDLEHKTGFFLLLERGFSALDRFYRRVLALVLRPYARFAVIGGGVLALILTFQVLYPKVKIGYIPVYDQSMLGLTLELPSGAALEETDRIMREMEEKVAKYKEVKAMYTTVGNIQGGARSAPETGRQFAQAQIVLYDKPDVLESFLGMIGLHHGTGEPLRTTTDNDLAAAMRKDISAIPGGRGVLVPARGFGGFSAPVSIELLGQDLDQMKVISEEMRNRIAKVPGIMNPDISLRPGKPEEQIVIDRVKAAEYGLDVSQIGMALRYAITGDDQTKYREKGEQFIIRPQFSDADRKRRETWQDVVVGFRMVDNGGGQPPVRQPVYAREVASAGLGEGPNKIERKNRMRKAAIGAFLAPGVASISVIPKVEQAISDIPLGDVKMTMAGDMDRWKTEGPHLQASLILSIILVYLLMAVLFDNLLHPLTIQLSLPMAFVGAIMGLVYMDQQISIISIIGFIMLAGIVQKNAILLIDFTNTLRERGYQREEALLEAGPTRLRPILMTTAAMVMGMLPIALNIGRASESRAPLATAVIGGLILSTVLTLIIIPCIYTVFDDGMKWLASTMKGRSQTRALVEHAIGEEPVGAE